MSTMWKVTNTGIYEKIVIRIAGKAVFYMQTNKVRGGIRQQKEHLHTNFHDWCYTQSQANTVYSARKGK